MLVDIALASSIRWSSSSCFHFPFIDGREVSFTYHLTSLCHYFIIDIQAEEYFLGWSTMQSVDSQPTLRWNTSPSSSLPKAGAGYKSSETGAFTKPEILCRSSTTSLQAVNVPAPLPSVRCGIQSDGVLCEVRTKHLSLVTNHSRAITYCLLLIQPFHLKFFKIKSNFCQRNQNDFSTSQSIMLIQKFIFRDPSLNNHPALPRSSDVPI